MAHPLPPSTVLRATAAVTFAAALALILSPGAGAKAEKFRPEAFTGNCEMTGEILHEPPMTNQPTPTQVRGSFSGTCSGELTNRRGRTHQLSGAPGAYKARPSGELSCLGGTATGYGRLIIRRRPSGRRHVITVSLTERRTPGVAEVTLEGAAGGTGSVTGSVSAEELAEAAEQCSGSGLHRLRGAASIVSAGLSG